MRAPGFWNHFREKAVENRADIAARLRLCLIALLLVGLGSRLALAARAANYHLMKKMKAGGEGGWDYLNIDSQARQLYISRGDHVGVMHADTGSKVGEIANTP